MIRLVRQAEKGEFPLMMILLGAYWLLIAVLSYVGSPLVIKEKYRSQPWCKSFQKDSALPYAVLGAGFLSLGILYPDFFERDTSNFFLGLILTGGIAFALMSKVRKKYKL